MRICNLFLVIGFLLSMSSCQKEEIKSGDLTLIDVENARGGGGTVPDITSGLIAFYPFNGNANEAGGNFNGTVFGATLTKDRFDKGKKAYSFDGVNDYIFVPNINESFFDGKDFSLSVWVLFRNFISDYPHIMWGTNGFITFQGNASNNPYRPEIVSFYCNQENTPYPLQNGLIYTYSRVSTNQWHHITVTKQNDKVRIYVDGSLSNTSYFYANGLSLVKGTGLYFGTAFEPVLLTFHLDGNLDDIRIYSRALTPDQISYLAKK